mgnify:CR=1 FL=1
MYKHFYPNNPKSSILFTMYTAPNIKTKITDYGINNALVEIYVTIELKTDLIYQQILFDTFQCQF